MTRLSTLHRFLIMVGFRWMPSGLLMPIIVLLPLSRGLSLSDLGLATATQGFVVFALELPTGGLADAVGRRRVMLASMVVSIVSIGLFLEADSFASLAVAFAMQGISRALDSGPLEAWYVDTALHADPDTRIDQGMSAQGMVVGLAIATGALVSGGLVALDPVPGVDALALPVVLALVVQVLGLGAVALLMLETPTSPGLRGVMCSALETPRTVVDGIGLLRRSHVLLALVVVELSWGFGMICFEGLMPVRLAEVTGSVAAAAALTGPAASGAWIASAAGSAITPWLGRRMGTAPTAALMRLLQAIAVAGMGLFAGIAGIFVAYLSCYAVHGVSNAAHMTLLHRQATRSVRATVVSLNSMVGQPAAALGTIALTALAETTSVTTAMCLGAAVLAVGAPLYVPAWRQARVKPRSTHPARG